MTAETPVDHSKKWVSADPSGIVTTHCGCGWSASWNEHADRPVEAWHRWHVAQVTAELAGRQIDWYRATGHCGACGQPGTYCLCGKPCGCANLHPVGSGLTTDALEAFTVVDVDENQAELFPISEARPTGRVVCGES